MASEGHVRVDGSERAVVPGAVLEGPADPGEEVQVTLVLRRRTDPADLAQRVDRATWHEPRLDRAELAERHGADPADVRRVVGLAEQRQLHVLEADASKRQVQLRGRAEQMQAFFATELGRYRYPGGMYRGRVGPVHVPAEIGDVVQAVLGLDDRPQAEPHVVVPGVAPSAVNALSPQQVAQLYNFPTGVTGRGQTIGIIELGGGFQLADVQLFFSRAGLQPPVVTAVSVDGGQNMPSSPPSGADFENALDIQVAGGVAPGAHVVMYFAPNTDRGFLDAVTTAVHDTTNRPSAISISWGSAEANWTQQAMQAMEQAFVDAAALGVTVTCASGDNGSSDSVPDGLAHADFPASAPHALGCGGTTLNTTGSTINSETVWNSGSSATGGGISDVFALPTWQQGAGVPPSANPNRHIGRGVPDVSGDADPASGFLIIVGGNVVPIGGTSAVAPLWSGLVALLNEGHGTSVGFLQPVLYTPAVRRTGFRDITSGGNGAYQAAAGWDACTGLGSPNGQQLRSGLAIGLGDHFYTVSTAERDAAINQYGYLASGVAGYVPSAPTLVPLYRLASDHHLYTTSLGERDAAITQYGFQSEGVAVWVYDSEADGTVPLFRVENSTNGDYFYTTSADERDAAIRDYDYQSDGTACYVYADATADAVPVFRLINDAAVDHFYTASLAERDAAVAQYGYQLEGIAFYAAASSDLVPLYRLANGYHWYTTDLSERDNALYGGQGSQRSEDVACYVASSQLAGATPFYRLLSPVDGSRFYTTSAAERDAAVTDLGYQLESTSGYIYTDQSASVTPLFRLLKSD